MITLCAGGESGHNAPMNENPAQPFEAEVVGRIKPRPLKINPDTGTSFPESKITPKEARFIMEYVKCLSATEAAIQAGYTDSRDLAQHIGHDIIHKPKIAAQINMQLDAKAKRTMLSADLIIKELLLIASANPRDAFDERGELKDIRDMPENLARAISSFDVKEEYWGTGAAREKIATVKSVKFWCKNKALETLARHLKLLTDQLDITAIGIGLSQSPVINEVFVASREELQSLPGMEEKTDGPAIDAPISG